MSEMEWISVKERLPEANDEVWAWTVFHDSDQEYGDTSWLQDDGTWAMGSAKNFTVTHWMPLPEPPKQTEGR